MSDPVRYKPTMDFRGAAIMVPAADGGYIAVSDWEALASVSETLAAKDEAIKKLEGIDPAKAD